MRVWNTVTAPFGPPDARPGVPCPCLDAVAFPSVGRYYLSIVTSPYNGSRREFLRFTSFPVKEDR